VIQIKIGFMETHGSFPLSHNTKKLFVVYVRNYLLICGYNIFCETLISMTTCQTKKHMEEEEGLISE